MSQSSFDVLPADIWLWICRFLDSVSDLVHLSMVDLKLYALIPHHLPKSYVQFLIKCCWHAIKHHTLPEITPRMKRYEQLDLLSQDVFTMALRKHTLSSNLLPLACRMASLMLQRRNSIHPVYGSFYYAFYIARTYWNDNKPDIRYVAELTVQFQNGPHIPFFEGDNIDDMTPCEYSCYVQQLISRSDVPKSEIVKEFIVFDKHAKEMWHELLNVIRRYSYEKRHEKLLFANYNDDSNPDLMKEFPVDY